MTEPLHLQPDSARAVHAPGALLACDSDLVGVLVDSHGRRLVAIRPIAAGHRLFTIEGREISAPTRYSVQIGAGLHIDQECAHDPNDMVRRFFYRYMDHDCDPTTIIRNRVVISIRDIEPGDGITFNYNTTEYELATPFACRCGSALCVGMVRGAKYMTSVQRARVEDYLPDYLK